LEQLAQNKSIQESERRVEEVKKKLDAEPGKAGAKAGVVETTSTTSQSSSTPSLTTTPSPKSIKLVKSVTIQAPSGTITLQAGTAVHHLSFDSNNVRFRYEDADYEIPVEATDLR
jgi:hypothetical protein